MSNTARVIAALSLLMAASVQAQISNGGFESGFTSWSTTGVTAAQGSYNGQNPIEGSAQAALTTNTNGTVNQTSLEQFLGLNSGTLNSLNGAGTLNRGGSAIAQTFTLLTPGFVQFSWDFFPNGTNVSSSQNDSAFFTIHPSGSNGSSFTLLDQSSNHANGAASGYSTRLSGLLQPGTYVIGFAVYDVAAGGGTNPANAQDPGLLIDAVSIVPEPGTWALFVVGGVVGAIVRRRLR